MSRALAAAASVSLAPVAETLGQALRQPKVDVHLAQEQRTPVAGERAAGEIGRHLA